MKRKLAGIRQSGAVIILNLHRVAPQDGSSYPPLDPGLFAELLRFVQANFELTTFEQLDEQPAGNRPKLILSFDDGYKDFFDFALPLLDRHRIRVNQNVIPDCVESGLPPLNVLMQDFIGRAPLELIERLDVPGFDIARPVRSRWILGNRLSEFIKNKPIAEQQQLAAILREQVRRDPEFLPTRMMSLDELRQVAAEHEIGGHSYSHANMALETDEYLRTDVERCRAWFSKKLGLPLLIYALPNGSYRPHQVELIRDAGVKHILLVDEDFSAAGSDLHRRFTFDAYSRAEVRFRAAGAFRRPRAAA